MLLFKKYMINPNFSWQSSVFQKTERNRNLRSFKKRELNESFYVSFYVIFFGKTEMQKKIKIRMLIHNLILNSRNFACSGSIFDCFFKKTETFRICSMSLPFRASSFDLSKYFTDDNIRFIQLTFN